jgi:DNA-binding transcriptional MerR regulator
MSAQPERAYYGIGEVLARLRPEFPDVSTSKIRFLEAEGLIEPARSQSGYRRFAAADIERLRYILTAQRDEYLPLRVIKERLDAPGSAAAPQVPRSRPTLASALASALAAEDVAERAAQRRTTLLTRAELLDAAGIDADHLAELEDYGLLRRTGRHYGQDALTVALAVASLSRFGVGARHLRAVKAAAERETSLIEQVVAPRSRQRDPAAREAAARDAWQIAALTLRLHATLVEAALAEAGLAGSGSASAPQAPGRREGRIAGGLRSASGR